MNRIFNNPLISVIIPTYNRANIIDISLKSASRQSYKNIEIIVVDDASTDNTEEVVKAFGDSRIIYICHQSNIRGAAARNTGIKAAKGEYIAFLDSDDGWVTNKLELQLSYIQKHPQPNNVVSYTQVFPSRSGITDDTYHNFDEKYFLPKRGKKLDETISDYLFCSQGKTLTSTLMLHRSLALKTLFNENFKKHQDWDFCLRLEANGADFVFIPQPLTIWNGDPRFEHVGRISDYQLSESWFYECRSYLSSKAATAFLLEKILPSLIKERRKKTYAQKLILDGLFLKKISIKQSIKLTSQLWM